MGKAEIESDALRHCARRLRRGLLLAVLLCATALPVPAQWSVARQIGRNAAAAKGNEALYKIQNDSILARKKAQAVNVVPRATLAWFKEAERTGLGNFGPENRAYRIAVRELERLVRNAGRAVRAAESSPDNVAYYRRQVGTALLTATESINKVVRLALNGKVREFGLPADSLTGLSGGDLAGQAPAGGGKKRDDGFNLLSQVERMDIIDDCISELRTINSTLVLLAMKLEYDVGWSGQFARVSPRTYMRAECLVDAFDETVSKVRNFKPFRF